MLNQWMNLGVPHFQTSDTLERVGKKSTSAANGMWLLMSLGIFGIRKNIPENIG